MYCPKCGNLIEEGNSLCSNCNLDISSVVQDINFETLQQKNKSFEMKNSKNSKSISLPKLIVYSLIACCILIMSFIAASKISNGGMEIMNIQSVGGKTLEEAYYFELGSVYSGYAIITRMVGIFFASVLVWLGLI